MLPVRTKNREYIYLLIILFSAILFVIFSMSVNLVDRIYNFLKLYGGSSIAELIFTLVFLLLAITLWVVYLRWRRASKRNQELEAVLDAISPDVCLVLDSQGKITMCSSSIEKMFGYKTKEVLHKPSDVLFHNGIDQATLYDGIYEELQEDGFHIGLGSGKKRDGNIFPLEIISGNLSDRGGSVFLIRDITLRRRVEEELWRHREDLEGLVAERAAELKETNEKLRQEIAERKQVEEALRENEKKYRTLVENANDIIYLLEGNRFSFVNRRFEELLGYSADEVCSEDFDFMQTVAPESRELINNRTKALRQGEKIPLRYSFKILTKEGETRDVEVNTVPLGNNKVMGVLRDITELKQMEEELRESHEKYKFLVDNTKEIIIIVSKAGKVLFANKRALDISGYSEEEIIGKSFTRFIPKGLTKKILFALGQEILGNPQPEMTIQVKTKSGELRDIEIAEGSTLVHKKGKLVGILVSARDITERKKAEERIRQLKEFNENIVQNIAEGIALTDADGRFTFVNPTAASMLGYKFEELLGQNETVVVPPDQQSIIQEARAQRTHGKSSRYEVEFIRKDGTRIPVLVSGIPIIEEGRLTGTLAVFVDITERKKVEKKLRQTADELARSNAELEDFVHIASHDLREPLRKVSAFGGLLKASIEDKLGEDDYENLQFMINGALRMQKMIDDLVAYSRVTSNAKPSEPVDLNALLEELRTLELATRIEETKGTIRVPEPLPSVMADSAQVRRLLQNLIGNALKFTKENIPPEITIKANAANDGMVQIEVEDNGIGIDKKYHEQIFTMFKRLHARGTHDGSGIGLAVCKKIVERYNGQIGIRSKQGKGSTFWFTLPGVVESR